MKELSLNLAERQQQQQPDDTFKKAMEAEKGQLAKNDFPCTEITLVPPPPKPAAPEKKPDDTGDDDGLLSTDEDAGITSVDIPLRESLRVLSDALTLSKNPQFWADGTAPLTTRVSGNG